ncbi:MAG: hypothetical protein HZY76_07040 [Anaerolineae bacterium]|nr:MAG: hypothetical protein HZY76_07040 [Anaerolineae bacterium]
MVVTVELPAWQFEAAGSLPLDPGALLTVILDGGAVMLSDAGAVGNCRRPHRGAGNCGRSRRASTPYRAS